MTPRRTAEYYGDCEGKKLAGSLVLTESRYAINQSTPLHSHQNPLLYFVTAGCCVDAAKGIDGNAVHAGAGVLLPAGVQHSTHWAGGTACGCLHIELTDSLWGDRLTHSGLSLNQGATPFRNEHTARIAHQMRTELRAWDMLSGLSAEALAIEMLVSIARANSRPEQATAFPRWLKQVEARLRENSDLPLNLKALAEEAGVHPSHLVRTFRNRYHCTPGEYVRQLRIQAACTILTSRSEMPMAEIATSLGFADQSHFIRVFRSKMGVTPGEYRHAEHR